MSATLRTQRLLGRYHEKYGHYAVAPLSEHTVAALSVGADVEYAVRNPKTHANEDALLLMESERHTIACVADSHFGREASEELVSLLATALEPAPQTPAELDEVIEALSRRKPTGNHGSETTLLVAVLDRMFRQGFGRSWGDSTLLRVQPGQVPERLNERSIDYVTPVRPRTLQLRRSHGFTFSVAAGDLLIAHTDGIDECCYRDPDRSITLFSMAELLRQTGHRPRAVVDGLMRLALMGVEGQPGGQDNAALIVTRV